MGIEGVRKREESGKNKLKNCIKRLTLRIAVRVHIVPEGRR